MIKLSSKAKIWMLCIFKILLLTLAMALIISSILDIVRIENILVPSLVIIIYDFYFVTLIDNAKKEIKEIENLKK